MEEEVARCATVIILISITENHHQGCCCCCLYLLLLCGDLWWGIYGSIHYYHLTRSRSAPLFIFLGNPIAVLILIIPLWAQRMICTALVDGWSDRNYIITIRGSRRRKVRAVGKIYTSRGRNWWLCLYDGSSSCWERDGWWRNRYSGVIRVIFAL